MTLKNSINTTLAAIATAALFCSTASFAQAPSAPMQNPGMQQTQPGANNPANQDPAMNGMAMNGQTSAGDRMFVENALKGGMAEVQLGQLALQKSSNEDVKQFAQKMIDDHTKLGEQMKPIAQQINVKIPDGPSKKDKSTIAKLGALNGDAFDQAYIKGMVKDHKNDLDDFKNEAQNGSNPSVKDAANQGSKIITEHLAMIEQISQKSAATPSAGGSR